MNLSGVLIVDKPTGVTSHDVILRLRRILGIRRIGHTGTLDPAASGVLLACVGSATKVVQFLSQYDKEYEAVIKLGVTTDTFDADGKTTGVKEDFQIDPQQIRNVVLSFKGNIRQTPPPYSAIKHKGKKLYQYARANQEVKIEEREVNIKDIRVLEVESPHIKLEVNCSKGTYVRSLASDIGKKLGCGAHLLSLRRTTVGPFRLSQALKIEQVESLHGKGEISTVLVPIEATLSHLPSAEVKQDYVDKVRHGASIEPDWISLTHGDFEPDQSISIKDEQGKIIALGRALAASRDFLNRSYEGKLFDYARVI